MSPTPLRCSFSCKMRFSAWMKINLVAAFLLLPVQGKEPPQVLTTAALKASAAHSLNLLTYLFTDRSYASYASRSQWRIASARKSCVTAGKHDRTEQADSSLLLTVSVLTVRSEMTVWVTLFHAVYSLLSRLNDEVARLILQAIIEL